MDLIVKTDSAPESFVGAIKSEVQTVDRDQPLGNVQTLAALVDESIAPRRFSLFVVSLFAVIALVLGAVGLYGVMAYAVTQRTREFGIRVALGAQQSDVLRLVIRQGMLLSLAGVVIGVAGSFALTRLMSSLLFGVTPTDAMTFAIVSVILTSVALVACYVPARRATKVDPMVALDTNSRSPKCEVRSAKSLNSQVSTNQLKASDFELRTSHSDSHSWRLDGNIITRSSLCLEDAAQTARFERNCSCHVALGIGANTADLQLG